MDQGWPIPFKKKFGILHDFIAGRGGFCRSKSIGFESYIPELSLDNSLIEVFNEIEFHNNVRDSSLHRLFGGNGTGNL
jgi:hypothetical protein